MQNTQPGGRAHLRPPNLRGQELTLNSPRPEPRGPLRLSRELLKAEQTPSCEQTAGPAQPQARQVSSWKHSPASMLETRAGPAHRPRPQPRQEPPTARSPWSPAPRRGSSLGSSRGKEPGHAPRPTWPSQSPPHPPRGEAGPVDTTDWGDRAGGPPRAGHMRKRGPPEGRHPVSAPSLPRQHWKRPLCGTGVKTWGVPATHKKLTAKGPHPHAWGRQSAFGSPS